MPADTIMTCCIRPQPITLTKMIDPVRSRARNTIQNRIVNIQVAGTVFQNSAGLRFFCLISSVTRLSMDALCL
jgi:hypothetical protein